MARFTSGWIKLHRSLDESDISNNLTLLGLWTKLLMSATWKESKIIWNGKQRILPPGSVVFGVKEFSLRFNCSRTTIQRWLKYLHDTERLWFESGHRGCLATIRNWERYQLFEEPNGHQSDTNIGNHVGNRLCTSDTLSEEGKKERRKESNTNTDQTPKRSIDVSEAYALYPRKVGKSKGLAKLKNQIKTPEDLELLCNAIKAYSRSDEVQRGFVKHFSTFAGEWKDWLDPETGKNAMTHNSIMNLDLGD